MHSERCCLALSLCTLLIIIIKLCEKWCASKLCLTNSILVYFSFFVFFFFYVIIVIFCRTLRMKWNGMDLSSCFVYVIFGTSSFWPLFIWHILNNLYNRCGKNLIKICWVFVTKIMLRTKTRILHIYTKSNRKRTEWMILGKQHETQISLFYFVQHIFSNDKHTHKLDEYCIRVTFLFFGFYEQAMCLRASHDMENATSMTIKKHTN